MDNTPKSAKKSGYTLKICGRCGKRDDKQMARHSLTHLPLEVLLWDMKSELTEKAWCSNWQDFIENSKAKALNISRSLQQQKAFQDTKS